LLDAGLALKNHGHAAEIFDFTMKMLNQVTFIYSQDLAQTIADYKTQEIEQEKEIQLLEEKQKSDFYLTITVIVVVSLLILTILVLKYVSKSKSLTKRNKEKELLVLEIHHRVKNNFELVAALLTLQEGELENSEAKEKLHEGQNRIKTFSLIHKKLYEKDSLVDIDLKSYLTELTDLLANTFKNGKKVEIQIQMDPIALDVDTIVPLGLIINELITNSFKHAVNPHDFFHICIGVQNLQNAKVNLNNEIMEIIDNNLDEIINNKTDELEKIKIDEVHAAFLDFENKKISIEDEYKNRLSLVLSSNLKNNMVEKLLDNLEEKQSDILRKFKLLSNKMKQL
jgi:two-component sensor histidine kinase